MPDNERVKGIGFAAGSYLLWGILPVYWKQLQSVPSIQVLGHRVVWSLVFLLMLLLITGGLKGFISEVRDIFRQPRKVFHIIAAALLLNFNWGIYIWAVNNDHIIQTSLGYYINPLVSVLLGMLFLRERLSFWQWVAFFLAIIGVVSLTVQSHAFPWVALSLAVTFGFYGLLKKVIDIGAITGLALETALASVFALAYLLYVNSSGNGAFHFNLSTTTLLLIGAGAATATPLILFGAGARRLPLYAIGFLQYISPTIALLLGVLIYGEPFSHAHLLSFAVIWIGLIVFSLANTRLLNKKQPVGQSR